MEPKSGKPTKRGKTRKAEETREAVQNAAEVLFAKHGFDNVSTRQIADASGANLQAIHYYFGGKAGLFQSVFQRRIEPINAARRELLRDYLDEIGDGTPEVEKIVRFFVEPYFDRTTDNDGYGSLLVTRALTSAGQYGDDTLGEALMAQFEAVWTEFMEAFERALTGVPIEDIRWRFYLAINTLYSSVGRKWLYDYTKGKSDPDDTQELKDRLIPFLVRAMRDPPTF